MLKFGSDYTPRPRTGPIHDFVDGALRWSTAGVLLAVMLLFVPTWAFLVVASVVAVAFTARGS